MFWRCSGGGWRCAGGVWQCSGSVLAVSLYIVQPFLALGNIKALSVYMAQVGLNWLFDDDNGLYLVQTFSKLVLSCKNRSRYGSP